MDHYEKIKVNKEFPALIYHFIGNDESTYALRKNRIAPHWHRSIEVSYVAKGEVILTINHQKKVIKQGEFIFVNSGLVHELEIHENCKCEVVVVIISYSFLKRVCPEFEQYYFNIDQLKEGFHRLKKIYEKIREFCINPRLFDELMINAYLYEIIYLLLHECLMDVHKDELHLFRKQQHMILDYIEEHYREDLSLKKLAEIYCFSEGHFSRSFQQYFGINFKKYVTNYRLSCSYLDVLNTEYSIQEVAWKHGFSNIKSFITEFKKAYGKTPYQYRKAHNTSKKDNFVIKNKQQ